MKTLNKNEKNLLQSLKNCKDILSDWSNVTQKDIAELTGISKLHLYLALQAGLIAKSGHGTRNNQYKWNTIDPNLHMVNALQKEATKSIQKSSSNETINEELTNTIIPEDEKEFIKLAIAEAADKYMKYYGNLIATTTSLEIREDAIKRINTIQSTISKLSNKI